MIELAIGASLVALSAFALRALRPREDEAEDAGRPAPAGDARGDGPVDGQGPRRPSLEPRPGVVTLGGAGGPSRPAPHRPGAQPSAWGASEEPRGLRLGDVLLYDLHELWVAGTLEVVGGESDVLFRIHVTPANPEADAVAQFDPKADDLALLKEAMDLPAGRLPDTLRFDGLVYERRFRQPVRVWPHGEYLPSSASDATASRWEGPGDRVLIALEKPTDERLAWTGRRVSRALFDLLPGGDMGPHGSDR